MSEEEAINVFGETNYRNQRVQFGIKTDDRRRHMYVIGKTGMGKSHLLRYLAYNDLMEGRGFAFIDPHGDSADWLLEYVPSDRINDIVYINPTDIDYPIAFNIMEKVDRRYRNLVADGLVGVFKKIWAESWGPRLEYLLRNAILALLDFQDSTLLGVTRMLIDKDYRKKVIKTIEDPVVKAFWVDEFSRYNDKFLVEAIAPIQNKVGQFLSNSIIRNIVGQTKSAIDMRKMMDDGKVLIVNLSKGKIGEESSALLGAMLVTKLQLAAMSRADIPEDERRDFYLYVDEFQTFATESFADILSEARKYRLSLVMAHQYVEQMPEPVANAVFGNVGTLISFRIGATDAEVLEKEFEPVFMQNDLVHLPKYSFYIKLMIDGISGDGFSAATIPIEFNPSGNLEKVIRVSRERYASPIDVVEEKIARWSGVFLTPEEEEARRQEARAKSQPEIYGKGAKQRQPFSSRSNSNRGTGKSWDNKPGNFSRNNQGSYRNNRQPSFDNRNNYRKKNSSSSSGYNKPNAASVVSPSPAPRLKPSSFSRRQPKNSAPATKTNSGNNVKSNINDKQSPSSATNKNAKEVDKKGDRSRPVEWTPPKPPSVPAKDNKNAKKDEAISLQEAVNKPVQSVHQSKRSQNKQDLKPGEKASLQ